MAKAMSKVNAVKNAGQIIRQILDTSKGMEGLVKRMNIIKACNGYCLAEWKVEEFATNPFGTLHGGMAATLVDQVTSMAINSHEKVNWKKNVQINMYLGYLKEAKIGDLLQIEANTVTVGNVTGTIDAVIRNLTTGHLVAKGISVKYIFSESHADKNKNEFLPNTETK